jgi:hypothetical protein
MTSYNVDLFKEFVFSSKFLKLFKVEKEILERIREDEVEMMKFGFRWMKFSLFGEDAIKVKEEVLQAKKEKMAMR